MGDSLFNLTDREKKTLEKSWAKFFAENIFPRINERPFSVLYSPGEASRPNTPVNIIIGSLILKEVMGLTDDELMESLMFDVRLQYALHTTSFDEQPLSDRTLSRFRLRCYEHELMTGEDLIKDCVTALAGEMAALMRISDRLKRMDSLMVASNIKNLSRLELLYTCVANLVKYLHKNGHDGEITGMEHYHDPSDYNRVIYHDRDTDKQGRFETILADADRLLAGFAGILEGIKDYDLLGRVIREQAVRNDDGTLRLRTKEDGGMGSTMLQNPSDPDATYREKAGKGHKGYTANMVGSVGMDGSIVTDYQYGQNIVSDSEFGREAIKAMGEQEEGVTIVADGAYGGTENIEAANLNNINLVPTDLVGRAAKDILADFEMSTDGKRVIACAAGHPPKSCNYQEQTGQCRVSFHREQCEGCPHKNECNPKISKRTAVLFISVKSVERAETQRQMETDEHKELARFRNGVESIPSTLRRKYGIDNMPVRGVIRTKHWFGFKIAALNFRKLCEYLDTRDNHAINPAMA
jgi:hypothetical protein